MQKPLLLLAAILFLFPPAVQAEDLFTGTLEIRDGRPILVRCDLVKNAYFLVDKAGSAEVYLKQFRELGITPESPFQAQVFGEARMDGEAVILTVDSIKNIVPGSCHMDSLFK